MNDHRHWLNSSAVANPKPWTLRDFTGINQPIIRTHGSARSLDFSVAVVSWEDSCVTKSVLFLSVFFSLCPFPLFFLSPRTPSSLSPSLPSISVLSVGSGGGAEGHPGLPEGHWDPTSCQRDHRPGRGAAPGGGHPAVRLRLARDAQPCHSEGKGSEWGMKMSKPTHSWLSKCGLGDRDLTGGIWLTQSFYWQ